MSKTWKPDEEAALRALRNLGKTVPEISNILGRDQLDVRTRCVNLAIPFPASKRRNFTADKQGNKWPDYWSKNAAEGSAKLRDAVLSLLRKRAA